mmetsp:Transcript_100562/g.307324  ORF Transcript_100562/g.307324 Transcript_100562/m.307324 type:complete len:330 (+) Transcript_100562:626-1615(+)
MLTSLNVEKLIQEHVQRPELAVAHDDKVPGAPVARNVLHPLVPTRGLHDSNDSRDLLRDEQHRREAEADQQDDSGVLLHNEPRPAEDGDGAPIKSQVEMDAAVLGQSAWDLVGGILQGVFDRPVEARLLVLEPLVQSCGCGNEADHRESQRETLPVKAVIRGAAQKPQSPQNAQQLRQAQQAQVRHLPAERRRTPDRLHLAAEQQLAIWRGASGLGAPREGEEQQWHRRDEVDDARRRQQILTGVDRHEHADGIVEEEDPRHAQPDGVPRREPRERGAVRLHDVQGARGDRQHGDAEFHDVAEAPGLRVAGGVDEQSELPPPWVLGAAE